MTSFIVTAFDDVVNFFKGVKSPAASKVVTNVESALTQAEGAAPQIAEDVANAGLELLGPWGAAVQPLVDSVLVSAVTKLLGKHSAPAVAAQQVAQALQAPAAGVAPNAVG